jgi:hypothetical protein
MAQLVGAAIPKALLEQRRARRGTYDDVTKELLGWPML